MGRTRIAAFAAVAAAALAAPLFGGALGRSSSGATPAAPPGASADRLAGGFAAGDTHAIVERLQTTLRAQPQDARSYALLGLAYQQRARETADPAYYSKSEGALKRALALAPNDLAANGGLGSLALSRHRFAEALELGRRAQAISPSTARTYGVVGDALVELGRYREAFRAFDTMARLKPSAASYARVSYARELLGHTRAAVVAMQLAVDSSSGEGEPAAWSRVQLGKLYWSTGKIDAAARQYRAALELFPDYVQAYDALAQVEAARGRLGAAIRLERQAVERIPLPQFVGSLGDFYRAAGAPDRARRQYGLIAVIQRLLAANGVRTDLESALFNADHGVAPARTLALARRAQRERPSIDGDDVLAWALERYGRCTEALHYSQRALRLGTQDALKVFHRGMIERCLGRPDAGAWFRRALSLNPSFSVLWAPVARRYSS